MRSELGIRATAFLSILALVGVVAPASATTYYVCPSGGGQFLTIQEAIDVTVNGDEVVVCDGVLTGPGNRDLNFGGRAITVRSANGPEHCIIDCEGSYTQNHRGFYFGSEEPPEAVVQGFTIRNGYMDVGGAVYCEYGSNPTIVNCIMVGNVAEDYGTGGTGGGICAISASPTIKSCTFSDNTAASGGGIYAYEADPVITDCVVTDNEADYGAGIYCWGHPQISGCVVFGNVAGNHGGGLCCVYSNATITNCLVTGNVATTGTGGALYCHRSSPVLVNCTLAGNQATAGGAVRCYSTSSPRITSSVLWGDTPNELSVQSGSPVVTYCDVAGGWTGTGNIDLDPLFVGGYYLAQVAAGQAANSPCVDAGDPAGAMIDGTTRTDGAQDAGVVDMGYHYPAFVVCHGDLNCDGQVDFGDINDFVLALSNWPAWKLAYPDCPERNADVNGDGQYGGANGFGDINPFVALLATGGGQPIPCPTP